MVKCLGQLDTYGPLCDDAAQVKLTIEGRTLPDGKTFMGPIEKVVSSLDCGPKSTVSYRKGSFLPRLWTQKHRILNL
jgi:hypothetical protein